MPKKKAILDGAIKAESREKNTKLLNKKIKRNQKRKKLVKKFIDDEADEEDSEGNIYKKNDFEESENNDEYDLNDSFIDNDEIITTNKNIYREFELKKEIKLEANKIYELDDIKQILNIEFIPLEEKYWNEKKEILDEYYENKEKEMNKKYKTENLKDIKLFKDIPAKKLLFVMILICKILLIHYNFDEFHYDMWEQLQENEIEDNIINFFKKLLTENFSMSGFLINFLSYYLLGEQPSCDLEIQFNKFNKYFNLYLDPQNIEFKILKNPNQTKKIYETATIKNYKKKLIENFEFYKDKAPDYDEKVSAEQKKEDLKKKEKINNKYDYLENAQDELLKIGTGYSLNRGFDNDFEIFKEEKKEYYKNDQKLNTSTFGIVIYMDKNRYYNDPDIDKDIHFPHSIPVLTRGILFYLKNFLSYKHINKIIVAHEHGDKLKKCHYQAMIKFYEKIQCKIPPGSFIINDKRNPSIKHTYLIMFCSVKKNEFALENYVKKKDELVPENKFFEFNYTNDYDLENIYKYFNIDQLFGKNEKIQQENEEQDKKKKPNDEYWDMVLSVPNLDCPKLKNMCISKNDQDFTKFVMSQHKNILHFNHLANPIEVPEFKWMYPKYALEYMDNYNKGIHGYDNEEKYMFYKYTYDWFKTYCENNDPNYIDPLHRNRKTGFLVFGPGKIGKTTFFSIWCGLYGDPRENPFIVYCRNTISWDSFEKKMDTCQMVILDDIYWTPYHIQLIKALAAGEPCYIRSLYVDNKYFNKSCPTVFLTNEDWLYDLFIRTPELCDRYNTMNINMYIGPEGTKPNYNTVHYSDRVGTIIYQEFKEKQEKRKDEKKTFFKGLKNFSFYRK